MATTPSPRIYAAKHIQRGPADLWLNLTKPADGTHVITLHTDGSPDATTNANAAHAGLLSVPSVFTYTPKPDFEVVDQDTAAVVAFANTEEAVIEAEMSQLEFAKVMKYCLPGGTSIGDGAALDGVTLGLGGNIIMTPTCLAVIAPAADGVFKWAVALLYAAVPASAVKLSLGRTKSATYQVQFRGLSDLTRTAGDRIGSIYKTV
jgi:hypothetical protein